jgi:hypothetical protein
MKPVFTAVMTLALLTGLGWLVLRPFDVPVTFEVDADTEIVSVSIKTSPATRPLTWNVSGFELITGSQKAPVPIKGDFTPADGTVVQFVRVGSGILEIRCSTGLDRGSVGAFDPPIDSVPELGHEIALRLTPRSGDPAVASLVFPFVGTVEWIGREVPLAAGVVPLLHAASVRMLLSTHGGPVMLDGIERLSIGDAVVFDHSQVAYGFVHVAEKRMRVSARVLANNLSVRRMGSDGYAFTFSQSLADALIRDRVVQGIWGALVLFALLVGVVANLRQGSPWYRRWTTSFKDARR